MAAQTSEGEASTLSLLTSLAYHPHSTDRFPLLHRHLHRLHTAHSSLARDLPASWCASVPLPSDEETLAELERCVEEGGKSQPQRVRLTISPRGKAVATSAPLADMPGYPVQLVLDSITTECCEPIHAHKTTSRAIYDDARARVGATLHPSSREEDPPFDVIMHNDKGQVTETSISNIAFKFDGEGEDQWLTPPMAAGLLPGVQRQELLENGTIREGTILVKDVLARAREGKLRIICFNGVRGVFPARLRLSQP